MELSPPHTSPETVISARASTSDVNVSKASVNGVNISGTSASGVSSVPMVSVA